jgi:kynurenine formamidase
MTEARIIDLSYPVTSEMLVYPNTERPVFEWLKRANSEGVNLTRMRMLTHTGTHTDAPLHFLEDGPAIDQIPLDRFMGRAKLFRFNQELNGQEITLNDLLSSGFDIEENMIFVLETGIERYMETAEYNTRYPVPSIELIQFLIENKIKSYMTDTTSVDPLNSDFSEKHHMILKAGIPIVENLKNLRMLPENRSFFISALPLRLVGREGAPCRAVAVPEVSDLTAG